VQSKSRREAGQPGAHDHDVLGGVLPLHARDGNFQVQCKTSEQRGIMVVLTK
jgi:hypothetical protein